MAKNEATLILDRDGVQTKLCKVMFSKDGSFQVLVPYHPQEHCSLFKIPVNYITSVQGESVPYAKTLDAGKVEDNEVKLSHHRSGFTQFSGPGVVSGLTDENQPKGVGIQSFALDDPAAGPSFGISFWGIEKFDAIQSAKSGSIVFRDAHLTPVKDANAYLLEGFYLPPRERPFVKTKNGSEYISLVRPSGIVIEIPVLLADLSVEWPGLIGLNLYKLAGSFGTDPSGFVISGPTGNNRLNEKGERVGEGIYCACPGTMALPSLRNLNFVREKPKPQ